jgi:hypothetical protein
MFIMQLNQRRGSLGSFYAFYSAAAPTAILEQHIETLSQDLRCHCAKLRHLLFGIFMADFRLWNIPFPRVS